jgi:hypothetical protein
MMPTPGNRRAAEFAALLERPARTDDPALAPYVALAGALSAVPAPAGPAPEFRDALRQRLMAVATVQGVGQPDQGAAARLREAGITWNFQRRMAIVAGSAAAATAIAGVGIGASKSLPGDAFYGVKRATEDVQLALTTGQEAKGKRHLQFARTRLHEVESLVGRNSALSDLTPGTVGAQGRLTSEAKTSTIVSTLEDMDAETRAGAEDLLAVHQSTGSPEPLRALDSFTRDQFDDLRSVISALPVAAQPRAERSLSLLAVVADRTRESAQAGTGTPSGNGGGPSNGQTGKPSHSATPHRSASPRSGQSSGSSSPGTTPATPGVPGVPTQVPTQVPTIPSLPTVLPAPTSLPTSLPALPDLPDLPLLGN